MKGTDMKILVTGGAGYIGSHTCIYLINNGFDPVIADDLSNSSEKVLDRIEKIAGKRPLFYKGDVSDPDFLRKIFGENKIDAVIHFAGYKAVGESVEKPLMYYTNNLGNTLNLIHIMEEYGVKKIIFSSSATVYGSSDKMPLSEESPKGTCSNPYGWTKWMIEQILTDIAFADKEWKVILLRYFNPIGAHESGLIGEDPNGIPNNLMPYITQVAVGRRKELGVFGNDYPTPDGTGVRDFIHVCDLAEGHVKALEKINGIEGTAIYNLGTGRGCSVLEVVAAFEKTTGVHIPYAIKERRAGDTAVCYCDPSKAEEELGFKAQYDIEDMCRDSWNWQKNNPNGYSD